MLPPAADLLSLCRPWSGVVFRSASPGYATTTDVRSGLGPKLHGGRWTPKGAFPASYLSLEPETAVAESLASHRYYSLPLHQALPRLLIAAEASLKAVLILSDPTIAASLGLDLPAILAQDWRAALQTGTTPDSHTIAVALHAARVEAFIVPSAARPGFSNLVIFPDNLRTASTFSVL